MTTKRAVTIVLGIFLITASIAAAGSKVKGTLYSLGSKDHKVTLKDSSGRLQTFNVASAKVKRNGSTTTLTGLVIGDSVSAGFKSGGMNPTKLKANGPKVSTVAGPLQGVHSSSFSVQVGGQLLKTTAKSHLIRNGAIVTLSKLTKKDTVTVHVNSSGECDDIDSEGPDDSEIAGIIASVDTTAGTITITPEDRSSDVTLFVTADTEIELDDDDALLSNLIAGDPVEAEYDPATLIASSIEAENPESEEEIHGTITAIDLTLGTLTIQSGEEGDDDPTTTVTVNVTANTQITLDDNVVYVTDLAVGDRAEVDYDPASMNAFSVDAESPEIEGTITALDSGAGTLTITDEDGVAVSLTADSSTIISLEDDETTATLADLAVGMEADATYNAATFVALEIEASSEDDAPVQKSPATRAPAKTKGSSQLKKSNSHKH